MGDKYLLWDKIYNQLKKNKTISKKLLLNNYVMLLAYVEFNDKVEDFYDFSIDVNYEKNKRNKGNTDNGDMV